MYYAILTEAGTILDLECDPSEVDEKTQALRASSTGYSRADVARQAVIITLSGARKKHLTRSNEEGGPLAKTLCGKVYDPGDRKSGGTKTNVITGSECDACAKKATYKRPWRTSRNDRLDEFKTHFIKENGGLACGQRMACFSVPNLARVTCERCLDLA